MSMKRDLSEELSIVDLSDEELKEFLGYVYSSIKNLDEFRKNDDELKHLKSVAKEYENDNYVEELKTYKAKAKAAHAQMKVRGIKFRLPEELK